MGRISDSESEEIQRNLERFMDQQIKEYEYTKGGNPRPVNRRSENTYRSMEIDVPNLEAPKAGRRTAEYSFIDIDRNELSDRSYDDDLDDDFDIEHDDRGRRRDPRHNDHKNNKRENKEREKRERKEQEKRERKERKR